MAIEQATIINMLIDAQVPAKYRLDVLGSLEGAKKTYFDKVLFYKLTAWIAALPIVLAMRWKDDEVPKWASRYRNNISPNGDRANWRPNEEGHGERQPIPLSKKEKIAEDGLPFNYYAWKLHPRHWLARYIWLGIRNPGAGRALDVGMDVSKFKDRDEDFKSFWEIERWGDEKVDRDNPGLQVLKIGPHWQIRYFRKWKGCIYLGTNIGYKISNLEMDFPPNKPGKIAVTWGTIPYIWKGKKSDKNS